ncbi:hypothetical protein OEZ72_25580, partial [Leclercia adecarboxylata]
MTTTISPPPQWSRRRAEKARRLDQVQSLADGVVLPSERIVEALEPGAYTHLTLPTPHPPQIGVVGVVLKK